jgi:regulator of ribonuclease activity A
LLLIASLIVLPENLYFYPNYLIIIMSLEYVAPPVLEFKPTCDVCDEQGPDNALVPENVQWKSYGSKKQYCGYAMTITCTDDNTWVKELIESSIGEGKVLVIDASGNTKCALFGDKIGAMAVENKWEGIVLYGCVRDVDGLAQLDIGIHAIGNVPNKSIPIGGKKIGMAGGAISIGNASVSPGDIVFADNDGVVFVKNQHN